MRRLGRFLGHLIKAGLLVWGVTCLVVWISTTNWYQEAPSLEADAIVCLGGGQEPAGSLADSSLRRATTCGDLFREGLSQTVVFTGAGSNVSVAELMAEAAQIPASAAVIEPAARSTLQNALFSLALLPEAPQIILVSDGYHLPRSWVSFKLMGVGSVELVAAGGQDSVEVWEILREGAAIWFNLLRGGAYWLTGLLAPEAEWRVHLLI